ncbi:amino acid adenylation domain-containing protein [Sorangium sp. So ce1128]
MIGGVVRALYERARTSPDAPALMDDRGTLSFGQLAQTAARIRALLHESGARPGDTVAICSENGVGCVAAMYGILDAGCAFVPLSPLDPDARLSGLCERARPVVLLASRRRRAFETTAVRLDLDDMVRLDGSDPSSSAPGREGATPDEEASANDADAVAYVIFTSGSTGDPKGVCVPNRSFFHASRSAAQIMGFDAATRSLVILPLHFDGSFSSVFPVLLAGGCVFLHRGPICPPPTFLRHMRERALTHTTMTPTYLRALMADDAWSKASCESWRTLALGGESPPKPQLQKLRAELPGLRVFNRYGPTEATMAVSTLEITGEMLASEEKIPIGTPHPGVDFVALGPHGGPCGAGELAELYIGGVQLMTGYLGDPRATAAVLGPFHGGGRPLLKTGDLVTVNSAGQYVFVERVDDVVKRHGTRISLGEIEAALGRIPGVGAAVCVKATAGEEVRIVAFLQRAGAELLEREVRRDLLRALPASMSPDLIQFVDQLPRASGGKVDRSALARLASEELRREAR